VVDDEQGIRHLVATALARAGYAVHAVADAAEAIEAFQRESFDLLLSDVMMPGMNGHELAQWVALNHPDTLTALMTAFDPTCQECSSSPRCSMLLKPFLPKDLVSFVARVLSE
jgi:DNA-binding NtrC family response regulator